MQFLSCKFIKEGGHFIMAQKIKNNRNLPTANEILINKKFNVEVLISLLLESKWNREMKEEHRYIYKNNISYADLAKVAGVSINTFKKGLSNLIELGYIRKKEFNGEEVYIIPQKYKDGHLLFEVDFLNRLLSLFKKNLIKTYLQYYKYCCKNGNTGVYRISQKETLKAIGLNNKSESNVSKLKDINTLLKMVGLIEVTTKNRATGTVLEIRCPHYTETKLYKELKSNK